MAGSENPLERAVRQGETGSRPGASGGEPGRQMRSGPPRFTEEELEKVTLSLPTVLMSEYRLAAALGRIPLQALVTMALRQVAEKDPNLKRATAAVKAAYGKADR